MNWLSGGLGMRSGHPFEIDERFGSDQQKQSQQSDEPSSVAAALVCRRMCCWRGRSRGCHAHR